MHLGVRLLHRRQRPGEITYRDRCVSLPKVAMQVLLGWSRQLLCPPFNPLGSLVVLHRGRKGTRRILGKKTRLVFVVRWIKLQSPRKPVLTLPDTVTRVTVSPTTYLFLLALRFR